MATDARAEQERAIDATIRGLVKDLHTARPEIFWSDFLASALIGWLSLWLSVKSSASHPLVGVLAGLISALAFYRGLCFTHEITHLRRRAVPGFETVWNLLIGVPFLLPSFTYVGVHQSHHSLSTYGTKDDPEYLPFASSRRLILIFAVQSSVMIPIVLVLRFVVLAPVGLAWPKFHRWLEAHASSFSMNPAYTRHMSAEARRQMQRWEALMCVVWLAAATAVYAGWISWRAVITYALVLVMVCFLNTLRVLGAHEYDSNGQVLDREGQLLDSIDTPGGPWTELWAPVGLRYHALHHYFPGIPYHNLGRAYRRIVEAIPADAYYCKSTSPSLRHSLRSLYAKAGRIKDFGSERVAGAVSQDG